MIDPRTGSIAFDRGTLAEARAAFLASPLGAGAEPLVDNGEHRSYSLARPLTIGGHAASADVYFRGDALATVMLSFSAEEYGTSWDDWSEDKELARRDAHTAWLSTFLDGAGPHWLFSWGAISSLYDERTGGSYILVTYARTG